MSCPFAVLFRVVVKLGQDIGRVDVSETAGISTGIAARYATAVFDLAKEGKDIKALETDVAALQAAINDSADFNTLLTSPLYNRDEQGAAVAAIAKKMKLSKTVGNVLSLLAAKRRLFVLPHMLAVLQDRLAEERGEITAEVTTAKSLTKAQSDKLAKTLSGQVGKTVTIKQTVDESIIGGLIVKVGSRMIDTSIAAKLNALQNTMKEVG
ncbi:ATP synthase subunit delta [Yoonia vestfoldensis]|jgi:F-type H+-transporting ATPase subunit delta|uniref:ATP synthase subunit delta n=1 Tax=Yoonia vestfoldensis TaxID=245188 RepID=A0A1Y0E7G1_9RHOB|nr:ATP synthase subunit delta [Yoonia vestfoldensis]